ncbi:copper chaperone CopZ [bacterium BMS3Abin05]|nr:copper chaperone CopZ [bacterium BMS3Abin05]GBE28141.1 copper chaperone CopZ [bacterium BMS3Bbin03]
MKDKLVSGGGILTALLASLCCITPVLAVLGGLGGVATAFSFLNPFRLYFIVFTIIILGYAFYRVYRPVKKNAADCDCEGDENGNGKRKSFLNSKKFLWIVTFVSALLITFPYYSHVLFPAAAQKPAVITSATTAELQIEGMTCTSCETSVNNALKSRQGVIWAESSFKDGKAEVEYDKNKVNITQLKKAIEKAGYKVTAVKKIK